MVAVSAWQRWLILDATPYPVGVDGYFYAIQVRSLLEHGTLAYPASPLTFWWMAPFALAAGGDAIVGAKLAAALGGALIAVPMYFVGRFLGRDRNDVGAGLVAAALAASSAGSAYLSFEFVKQGIGTLSTISTCAVLTRRDHSSAEGRSPLSRDLAIGALATLLAHKLAFVMLVVLVAPSLVRIVRPRALVIAAIAVVGVALVGVAMPRRLPSPADLDLARGLFAAAHWSLPTLDAPGAALMFRHEPLIAGATCAVAALVLLRSRDAAQRALGWPIVALGLAIALPWLAVGDPQGLGFRLRIVAFVPMALGAAIAVGALPIPHRTAVLAVAAAALFAVGAARQLTEGEVVMHPGLAAATANAAGKIPPGATVIVPERRILFPIRWYTRAPASLRPEGVPYAQRVRIVGLTYIGGEGSPLDRALSAAEHEPSVAPPIQLYPGVHDGLVLITEPTWDWLMAHVPDDVRVYFTRWPTL